MIRIDDAIVREGSLVLSHLPFHDGQRVRVVIDEVGPAAGRRTIQDVRRLLRGGVTGFDDPSEPMIPPDAWDDRT